MAPPPVDTYTFIPPPPLPEFYGAKSTARHAPPLTPSETTVSSKQAAGADDGWHYEYVKKAATRTPAPSVASADYDVPLPAVYHICRICLRPRSTRYHRDYPIPADGVPPPPGICRRCRVAPADDLKAVSEVVEQKESNNIRIGVGCLVPDDEYVSNTERRERRAGRTMSDATWQALETPRDRSSTVYRTRSNSIKPVSSPPPKEREEIIFRHIHEVAPPPPMRSPVQPAVTFRSTAQDAVESVSAKSQKASSDIYHTIRVPPPPPVASPSPPSPAVRPQASSRQTVDDQQPWSSIATRGGSPVPSRTTTSSTRGSRAPARTFPPERTDSEIRRLARDEVERYRHAERRLERHPSPFAHGRMREVVKVPVERRIEVVKDTAPEIPWTKDSKLSRKDSRMETFAESHSRTKAERDYVAQPNYRHDDLGARQMAKVSSSSSSTSSDKTRWPVSKAQAPAARRYPSTTTTEPERLNMQMSAKIESNVPGRVEELLETFKRQEEKGEEVEKEDRCFRPQVDDDPKPKLSEAVLAYRKTKPDLPYPRDEHSSTVIMPSPSSHVSRPSHMPTQGKAREDDGEYEYVRRKVYSVSRSPTRGGRYNKLERSESYVHRTRPTQGNQSTSRALQYERQRRPSDGSSRVTFSKKVDISPTPPGSNASTSEFRDFSQRKTEPRERGKDLIAEYERRGRARSRDPEYYDGRDDTPRPSQKQYNGRHSGSEDTVPIASNLGRYRTLSESPSRERLEELANRERLDEVATRERTRRLQKYGPYTMESDQKRSASVDVEDGSTITDDSWEDVRRGPGGR